MNNNRGNSNNNNNRRRGRGNNNRPQNGGGGQQVNRIDSRARGNAPQLLEKYRKMAQDAHMNGDRVQAEYYLQFADHYFRVTADTRARMEEQRMRQNGGQPGAPNAGYAQGYQSGGGVSGDQWQDQDGDEEAVEFGMDANFPTYDRAQPSRDQLPRDQAPREQNREPNRDYQRDPQRDHQRDQQRDGRQRTPEPVSEATPAEGQRADEGEPIAQGSDNPFIRDGRGPRGPRGRNNDRRVGRRDDNDGPRQDNGRSDSYRQDAPRSENPRSENARPENPRQDQQRNSGPRERAERVAESAPSFDPSILPPAISIRADAVPNAVIEAPARPERTRAPKPAPVPAPVVEAAAPAAVAEEAPAAPKKRGRPRKNPLPEAQVDAEG